MDESRKEKIINKLQEAKKAGELKRENIKDIVQTAISETKSEFQSGRAEISSLIQEAIAAVVEVFQDKQGELKEETESEQLQQEIDGALEDIKTNSQDKSVQVKEAIDRAVENIKNSEEVALLQKRYAQLKAQLAIVQANLSSRYGENYNDASKYLAEAKAWYEKAREHPEVFTDKIEAKQQEFEKKLGDTGTAIAKKERQAKQLLKK